MLGSTEYVLFSHEKEVAILTLNRPAVLNALDFNLGNELIRLLGQINRDKNVRALLITGTGRAFSSGGDINSMKQSILHGTPTLFMHQLIRMLNEIIAELRNIKIPVIAAIPGITSGGGMDLALACDFRIGSENAKFKAAYTGIGLVPAGGGSYLLSSIIGPAKALEFFLLNDTISAPEALKLGILNKIVAHDQLLEHSLAFAHKLAAGATVAYGNTKILLNEFISGTTLEKHLADESQLQSQTMINTEDFKEGIRAFLEHRPPSFKGQ